MQMLYSRPKEFGLKIYIVTMFSDSDTMLATGTSP